SEDAMKRFIIERQIPKVGTLEQEQLQQASAKSNQALRQLGPDIQWVESFVAADKTFCVYLAKDEALIHRHAELSGFPDTKITEVGKTIDPATALDEQWETCFRTGCRYLMPGSRAAGVHSTSWRAVCLVVSKDAKTPCKTACSRPLAIRRGSKTRAPSAVG